LQHNIFMKLTVLLIILLLSTSIVVVLYWGLPPQATKCILGIVQIVAILAVVGPVILEPCLVFFVAILTFTIVFGFLLGSHHLFWKFGIEYYFGDIKFFHDLPVWMPALIYLDILLVFVGCFEILYIAVFKLKQLRTIKDNKNVKNE